VGRFPRPGRRRGCYCLKRRSGHAVPVDGMGRRHQYAPGASWRPAEVLWRPRRLPGRPAARNASGRILGSLRAIPVRRQPVPARREGILECSFRNGGSTDVRECPSKHAHLAASWASGWVSGALGDRFTNPPAIHARLRQKNRRCCQFECAIGLDFGRLVNQNDGAQVWATDAGCALPATGWV
jgi:hypothetical protein